MLPSLAFLSSVLAGLATKAGIAQLTKHGYLPQSTYIKAALKALEEDDLDEAISNYQLATKRWKPSARSEIASEIIESAISVRISKLQGRIDELEKLINPPVFSRQFLRNLMPKNRTNLENIKKEQQGFQAAISVLKNMKHQLNAGEQIKED